MYFFAPVACLNVYNVNFFQLVPTAHSLITYISHLLGLHYVYCSFCYENIPIIAITQYPKLSAKNIKNFFKPVASLLI